ncbi:hypothetical protein C1645_815585 [Glomus cerebriforme]|uniref:F-box domain-containing protein n=1 Tax=Glomus cerebriforme TaxID=658196 RepID=A0A397TDG5_9GLOM|nr:hypothetical protein C1645_815585 [Glomus cerebriforme]
MTISKLNEDVLYLILKTFKDHKPTLYSCLLVNKIWCKIIIPILWRDPWKGLESKKEKLLLNVIISHLSEESKNNLDQKIKKPLFNYITFCKHLNFDKFYEIFKIPIINNEIVNLFINENTNFTHIYIPYQFDYKIHIIPEAKNCFSELGFISCDSNINDDVLDGLTEICKPIKELKLFIRDHNNYGFVKLIKAIRKLSNFHLLNEKYSKNNESFCEIIENSLIQHAETIQYFKIIREPVTKILESFVNLKRLELGRADWSSWNNLENVSLPFLQILKADHISTRYLTSLIKNTSGYLTVIKINNGYYNEISNKKIIQAIYQNCPRLENLKLDIMNNNILELKQLLINCQYLNKLHILGFSSGWECFYWDKAFEILAESSPTNLFKFEFSDYFSFLEYLKLFFDSWKGRHPMIFKYNWKLHLHNNESDIIELLERSKAQGIIKKIIKKRG